MDETPPTRPSPLTPTPNTDISLWTMYIAINHRRSPRTPFFKLGAEERIWHRERDERRNRNELCHGNLQIKFLKCKRVQKWQSVRKALVKGWNWKRRQCKPDMEESWLTKGMGRAGFLLERNTELRKIFLSFSEGEIGAYRVQGKCQWRRRALKFRGNKQFPKELLLVLQLLNSLLASSCGMDWVSLLCVFVTLYIYIRQSSIYLTVFPAREFGALFSLSLNNFCLEPHLLKQCLWLGTDEKTQVRDIGETGSVNQGDSS